MDAKAGWLLDGAGAAVAVLLGLLMLFAAAGGLYMLRLA